jgi:hypothetical protein
MLSTGSVGQAASAPQRAARTMDTLTTKDGVALFYKDWGHKTFSETDF